jgi:hypothetical protein
MLASRQRHDNVILCASPTGNCRCGSHENLRLRNMIRTLFLVRRAARAWEDFYLPAIAALH